MSSSGVRRAAKSRRPAGSEISTNAATPSAASSGQRHRRSKFSGADAKYDTADLVRAVSPLLDLFAVCDAVFTEDGALDPAHRQVTLGRVYEEWKRTRKYFDPDFIAAEERRPRKRWKPNGSN